MGGYTDPSAFSTLEVTTEHPWSARNTWALITWKPYKYASGDEDAAINRFITKTILVSTALRMIFGGGFLSTHVWKDNVTSIPPRAGGFRLGRLNPLSLQQHLFDPRTLNPAAASLI